MASYNKNYRRFLITVVVIWFIGLLVWYLHAKNFAILNPRGLVAIKQRRLMLTTVLLSLIVVIPVYVMLFSFAWRYREGRKARYSPNLSGHWLLETIWWGIPSILILILSVITWNTSHSLAPQQPLASTVKPLTIQVVALQWNWLFIYPEQKVASLNYVELPVGQPVRFKITADAPMNSFWIPQLGSQIYAMPGMSTTLNLRADQAGSYEGSSANISGRGFADMRFTAQADTPGSFEDWLQSTQLAADPLEMSDYNQLAKPSDHRSPKVFSSVAPDLYDQVLLKYTGPGRS